MKNFLLAAVLGGAMIFGSSAVHAQGQRRGSTQRAVHIDPVKKRQIRQQHMIRKGVRNGTLTYAEAARLQQRHRATGRSIRMAKADGHITRPERAIIRREQQNNLRKIQRHQYNGRLYRGNR